METGTTIIHKLIRSEDMLICYECGLTMGFYNLNITTQGDQAGKNVHHVYFESDVDPSYGSVLEPYAKPSL